MEKIYRIRLLRWGYIHWGTWHPPAWIVWSTSAASEKEAMTKAKQRFRRAEQFKILPTGTSA